MPPTPAGRFFSGVTAVALGATVLVLAPEASASNRAGSLTSSACTAALRELAKAQQQGPAATSLLDRAQVACSDGRLVLPKAQFAVVTDLDAATSVPVGLVFGWTDTGSMTAANQDAPTHLILNGTGVASSTPSDLTLARNHKAQVNIGGTTYRGLLNASNGDAGESVVFAFASPVGRISKAQARRSAVRPREGDQVVVFTGTGPKRTTIGPSYRVRTASLNRRVFGVVTSPDGRYRGTSSLFGTGQPSPQAAAFFAHRAVFEPYAGITDHAVG